MKTIKIICWIWISLWVQVMSGQRTLDTIYANEHNTVALFFPHPIRQAVTGDKHFIFSYDREVAGHLGLLQGSDGVDSNLLVITTDGTAYAYIVVYAEELDQMNYFIDEGSKIGVERPERTSFGTKDSSMVAPNLYDGLCSLLLDKKSRNLGTARSDGIRMRLMDRVYEGNEVYLLIGINNRSGIDFEMGRLDIFRVNGSKKRRASHQEIPLQPLYVCQDSPMIPSGEMIKLVCILPKFVLGKGEALKLVLEEARGNRRVTLVK